MNIGLSSSCPTGQLKNGVEAFFSDNPLQHWSYVVA
jgi:hypothetical protein